MGSCASKPKYVDYDPPMRHQQKKNEEHEVKQEDNVGVSPVRRSGSRPSLGILFQKEKDEQGELLTQQDEKLKIQNPSENVLVSDKLENSGVCAIRSVVIEDHVSINGLQEKDKQCELLTQQDEKLKIQNPSENVPVSDKLENSGASAIQSVVIEDQVKPAASLASAEEVHEEPLNHETLTASLDGSSTNKAQDVGTDLAKINDLGLPTATQASQAVEVSDVVHVENITGVEGCMAGHESENQLMTVDTATERGDSSSSSLKDDHLNEDAQNSLKPGTELPVVDIEDTSDTVQDNNLGTKIPTSHVDNIEKSQDSEVKLNVVNDYQKSDVEDKVLGATLTANESYVPNTTIDNTCQSGSEASPAVGDCISNTVKVKNLDVVAIDRNYVAEDDSRNSLKSETMISNYVNHTSGAMEDKEACDMKPSTENHDAENFLKPGSKLPVVDDISSFNDAADNKVGATQQGAIDNDYGNDTENALKFGKEVPNIDLKYCSNNAQDADLDVTVPVDGSGQEACSRSENTDPVPVEDHRSNSNTLETIKDDHTNSLTLNEEQISESIKASGNELDAIKPVDGFIEESYRKTENTDLVPVEYHHGNSASTAEEQFFESKKDSVVENVDSVVPTSVHISSVVEESVLSGKESGERSVTETVEAEGIDWQVEELAVSSQSDHLVTKAEAETTDVDNNANQDNECSGTSSQEHREELTQNKYLPVLESASEENCQTSSTNLSKELAENDKVPNVENVEGASLNNTHVAVSSQSDHLVTKAETEATDVDKNANQDNECSGTYSQVHREELTQSKHLPVLESASEENCQASSTNLAKELAKNDKVPNVENVEGASVNNTHHVKDSSC